jgi:hypothetical protein
MDRIATGPPKDRRDLFSETASRLDMNKSMLLSYCKYLMRYTNLIIFLQ